MDELAKRFADLADKYGHQAVEAARQAARTHGYSAIVESIMTLVISFAFFVVAQFLWHKASGNGGWHNEPIYFISGLAFLSCGITFFGGMWNLINPWTWTAISHPDVWIAKRTIGL